MSRTQYPSLAAAVAAIESGGNPYAMRFEPGELDRCRARSASDQKHDWRIGPTSIINHCNTATAEMIVSTSWGLYQLLGVNIYSPAVNVLVPIGKFLYDQEEQTRAFNAFTQKRGINFSTELLANNFQYRADFARAYNGPATTDYAEKLLAAIKKLSIQIPDA